MRRRQLDGVCEIARAASEAATARERAHDVLAALPCLLPHESALFVSWDPLAKRHRPLANAGYGDRIVTHLCSKDFERELTYFGSRASSQSQRVQDLPCPPASIPTFATVLSPEGFAEGLTLCLNDRGGRYLGLLNLSTTESTGDPSDAARDAIDLLGGTLANAIDTMQLDRHLVELAEPGATALMIDGTGATVDLPGGDERLLTLLHDDRVGPLAAARRLLRGEDLPARFVWRPRGERGWRRIHVIVGAPGDGEEPRALIAVGAPIDAYGLTSREMEVLSFIVRGWSNRRISEHFVVAQRTVATHVERVLAKLGECSRAGAAGKASREGLLFPSVFEERGGDF